MTKTTFLFLLVSASVFSIHAHDIKVARFNVAPEQGELSLQVQLDQDYILHVLGEECGQIPIGYSNLNSQIRSYLLDNFILLTHGYPIDYELDCFEYENGFVYASGSLYGDPQESESLTVINTCMVRTIEDHNNIVTLSLNGDLRSFRMHRDRTQTMIQL